MRVLVRVRPGASRTRVGGRYGTDDPPVLGVWVTARAVDGEATRAVIDAIAQAFGVPRRAVRLRSGATSRTKTLDVDVGESEGSARLRELLTG